MNNNDTNKVAIKIYQNGKVDWDEAIQNPVLRGAMNTIAQWADSVVIPPPPKQQPAPAVDEIPDANDDPEAPEPNGNRRPRKPSPKRTKE